MFHVHSHVTLFVLIASIRDVTGVVFETAVCICYNRYRAEARHSFGHLAYMDTGPVRDIATFKISCCIESWIMY
jgi:hypothetical protein